MKPLLRGYIHQGAFVVAIIACGFLLYATHTRVAFFANAIYSFSLIGLFGISALYHSVFWGFKMRGLMRRIDHSAIFALIAGTATPICLLGLPTKTGEILLIGLWTIAVVGMLLAIFWGKETNSIRATLYIAAGWFSIPFISQIKIFLGLPCALLLLAGGIIYTIGAIVYACKKPNPFPGVFGYHEVFHALVVIASALHFAVIYHLATLT